MKTLPRNHGVIVPIVTPVTPTGQLDERAAERLVDHLAGNGCGMLVLGTTGEVASLGPVLRRRYVEIAVKVAAKRTPVFACVAHNCVGDSIELGREHLRAGADALVAMLPNFFKLEPADMRAYFEQIAAGVPGPVLLYNMPQTTGMSLPVEIIEQLSRAPNIAGLKDSENTPGRLELVAKRLGGRSDFALFIGVAALSVPAFKLGYAGCVPSSGNLYPERWRALYDAAIAGDWARASQLQQQLDTLGAVFQRNRTLGQSLAALKAGLGLRQLCGPDMTPPLTALPEADQAAVRDELVRLG
jgi:4-hydroxy-tetrahydrodipicolinate synthase